MFCGLSGGKKVIEFPHTSNRGRFSLLFHGRIRFNSHGKCIVGVSPSFTLDKRGPF